MFTQETAKSCELSIIPRALSALLIKSSQNYTIILSILRRRVVEGEARLIQDLNFVPNIAGSNFRLRSLAREQRSLAKIEIHFHAKMNSR